MSPANVRTLALIEVLLPTAVMDTSSNRLTHKLLVTALIVPGTGTPNADKVTGFEQNVQNYYLGATSCSASHAPQRAPSPGAGPVPA